MSHQTCLLSKLFPILLFVLIVFNKAFSQLYSVDIIKGPVCVVRDSATGHTVTVSPEISKFNVVVTDGIAHITLTQLFVNPFRGINDIVYVFPLPHDGAVHAMSMEYNGMIYKAEIFEKTRAQQVYDSVKVAGGIAALLLQNRPNVFQQRLANIPQGDTAYIKIEVSTPLKYDHGVWELAIPTMVGERFQSANSSYVPSSGTFWNPPADRSGQSLQMNVLIQTGYPITRLNSPSHALSISEITEPTDELLQRNVVRNDDELSMPYNHSAILHSAITYPNRDFVLRFSRAQSKQDFSLASYYDYSKKNGYFSLNCFPDDSLFTGERPDLEIVLLVDISGSQNGWPLQKEKEISLSILDRLLPTDRFMVLSFSNYVSWCFGDKQPLIASVDNIFKASTFIKNLSAQGGTNLLEGVSQALSAPSTSEHKRIYIFLTDGFITNEPAILDEIKNHPTKPTVFTFGAGNNLNRYFLDKSALVGNGFSTEIMQYEDVETAVGNAWSKIQSPQLENVSVTIEGVDIHQMIMPSGSSLFLGRPLTMYGMYSSGGSRAVTVNGYRNGTPVTFSQTITLADSMNQNYAIAKIWAKQKIEQLSVDEGVSTEHKDSIIALSLEHQILSKYTAFLAVNPESAQEGESVKITHVNPATADRTLVASSFHLSVTRGVLTLSIPENESVVMMQIFDLKGRLVFNLSARELISAKQIHWDGRLPDGSRIKAGKYIVRIQTTRRVAVMPLLWKN